MLRHRAARRPLAAAWAGLVLATAALLIFAAATFRQPLPRRQLEAWLAGAGYAGEGRVIRQRGARDCGIACLQMMLSARGITASRPELEKLSGFSRAGTSVLGLETCLNHFGLNAQAWRLSLPRLSTARLPAIAFMGEDHFVVVDRITPGRVYVRDPARGSLVYAPPEFMRHWSHVAVLLGTAPAAARNHRGLSLRSPPRSAGIGKEGGPL